MDAVGLHALLAELLDDCRIAREAAATAAARLDETTESGLEGCAHHLCRFYNVVEQMALRIARTFENHLEDASGWHTELIRRVSLSVPGIRPALFPMDFRPSLAELKGFRHVFVHAYDLRLERRRLELLAAHAASLAPKLEPLCREFIANVETQESNPE